MRFSKVLGRIVSVGKETAKIVALTLLVIFLIKGTVVEANQVVSNSMAPTLRDGDYILVNKLRYGLHLPFFDEAAVTWSVPKRGDVVTFTPPRQERQRADQLYIKRIVALPGDRVAIRNGFVIVNGQKSPVHPLRQGVWQEKIKGGKSYSVFGEWHGEPFGPVTVPAGTVFVVGDNRGGSHDSRSFGPVPLSKIAGKAEIIYLFGHGAPAGEERGGNLL